MIRPQRNRSRTASGVAAVLLAALWGTPATAGFVITPTFDSSITNDPNAARIEATINQAIQTYEARFTDDVNVTIDFKEMATGLGQSNWYYRNVTYSQYRNALAADQTTSADATALAHTPGGSTNPVNGGTSVSVNLANLRALGITANPPVGAFDGTVSLNTSITNLDRTAIDPSKYDLLAVTEHEIDEVLGLGSTLDNSGPTNIRPEDLFRYDQFGSRSFTTDTTVQSYFSIDGGNTLLARFNQASTGDNGDWYSTGPHTPQVQDAFSTAGATPNLGVELTALDVIGYNLAPAAVPEPSSLLLLGALGAVSGAGYWRRKCRTAG